MKCRWGFDLGATSIGWSVFDLETQRLLDIGVRIFDDGREDKSKASLCVKRREARGARRLNNRKHIQKRELLKVLTALGLFPEDRTARQALKLLNPYQLRKEALDRPLEAYELGRVFMQLVQRKGFQSNRKDSGKEGGKLKKGYQELQEAIAQDGARTYGEFLYRRLQKNRGNPIRLTNMFNDDGSFRGGPFPFREIYQHEFIQIWEKQQPFYPQILTDENKKKIYDLLFFQRPLKEAEEGECQFEKGEKRLPKAHPLFQEFRIRQHLLNLKFVAENSSDYRPLDAPTCDRLFSLLMDPREIKPNAQGIIPYIHLKKALGLDKKGLFNFEQKENREASLGKGFIVNRTEDAINRSHFFADYWEKFTEAERGEIINVLFRPGSFIKFPRTKISIEDEDRMIKDYLCRRFGLSSEAAEELLYEIDLEEGVCALSEKAIRKILPFMKTEKSFSDACLKAGYCHSNKVYEHLERLPYYGEILSQSCLGKKMQPTCVEEEFGKINNATVHVALNQIRHLVNELIERYGKPYDLAVEYARELGASTSERKKMADAQDQNERENKKLLQELRDKLGDRAYNKRDLQKYKIWKRLSRYNGDPLVRECPFSGKQISLGDLLNGQKFQIEHLIPFSRSLDDSLNNKVLASVEANRYKANKTPYEAFGQSKDGYDWEAIRRRAKSLSYEQQWRFAPDAMERFEDQEGPIASSLNDTRYMTRLLQDYLQPIVREDGKQRVQAVAGALTAMIRKAWGLNQYKNEEDEEAYRALHNHHAIDAFIVSAIERSQIAETAKALKKVAETVYKEFAGEFGKFKDPSVSGQEKAALKKRIKDFVRVCREGIVNRYFPFPKAINVPEVWDKIAKINISHKPSLKNIHDRKSTIGQLHEDSAYGLKNFVDDKSLEAIFKCRDKVINKKITEYIPIFYRKEDKKAYYDAFRNWFVCAGKAASAEAKTKEEKVAKAALEAEEEAAVRQLRSAAQKAFKWFVGGGNFCAEIYEINPQNKVCGMATKDRGKWRLEIVSNYNATVRRARGEEIAYWRYKYPNAKRIMSLRRNDMVVAVFSREQAFDDKFSKGLQDYVRELFEQDSALKETQVLLRVKKMSGGRVFLTPHNIAKEKDDTKSWGASVSALQECQVRKVFVSFTGRIRHAK